ncbi:hypothetical protein ACR782_15920 [Sphingobacterium spiritivorum]|uniref:hypothetical protein n=1 Tax=Sphingobacterium spiritivorum TaxID=258 RepID=UPI003DA30024
MKYFLTTILLFFFSVSFAQFRNTKWGMTESDVIKAEGLVKYKTEYLSNEKQKNSHKSIVQNIIIDSAKVEIAYFFSNNKLSGGMYTLKPYFNDNSESYVSLWNKEKDNLIKKYGGNYHIEGDSYNWILQDQTIKAFYMDFQSVLFNYKAINVIYSDCQIKQADSL